MKKLSLKGIKYDKILSRREAYAFINQMHNNNSQVLLYFDDFR